MNILGIDPGVSNGVALYRSDTKQYFTFVTKDPNLLYNLFKDVAASIHQVVIERFAAKQISGYGLHTVRMVGGVEALCYVNNIDLIKHQPQQRLAFVDFAKKIIDRQQSGWVIHEADALAHVLRRQYDLGIVKVFAGNGLKLYDEVIIKPS